MNFERGLSTKDGLDVGIYRNRERKIGQTTRTIDAAIQFLFKSGNICIPPYSKITLKNEKPFARILNAFIDPDAHLNHQVQEHLWSKILDRLRHEHSDTPLEVNRTTRMIKLKI